MKKCLILALLLSASLVIGIVSSGLMFGCTQVTEITTTNALIEAGERVGQSTSTSNAILLGVSDVVTAVGNACGISGDPTQVITSFAVIPVPPPSSFFATREASWDGYLNVEGIHAGEVVSVRFSTIAGTVINGAIFSSPTQKKIADISGINWDDIIDPSSIFPTKISTIQSWATDPGRAYQNINSMWDYILWSSVLPKIKEHIASKYYPDMPALSTPESTIPDDRLGGFQGTVTREVSATNYGVNLSFIGTMEYNTSIDPAHEVPKSLSAGGTVTLPDETAVTIYNTNLGFVTNESGGIIPSTGSIDWIFTKEATTWSGTASLNGSSRTASGNVKRNGTEVGTLYLDATGGAIVTIEGQTINVTAPQ